MTVQTIYSELGPDLSAFPSENHFASWLMLAPKRDVSGGKVIRHVWVKGRNRVANALRMAAETLKNSQSYLGARYRYANSSTYNTRPKLWDFNWFLPSNIKTTSQERRQIAEVSSEIYHQLEFASRVV